MIVSFVSQALPYLPSRGGFRLYGGNLIRHLSRRHEIHLISLLVEGGYAGGIVPDLPIAKVLSLHDSWTLRCEEMLKCAQTRPERLYYRLLRDRKSTRLNSSHGYISYAVFCLKKKKSY